MADYSKSVRKVLSSNGCHLLRRSKGSHDTWYSPVSRKPFTVTSKIDSRHLANEIMKQAGINHKF